PYPGLAPGLVGLTDQTRNQAAQTLCVSTPMYFCPSRRSRDNANVSQGFNQRGGCLLLGNVPGALGDYAASIGTTGCDYTLRGAGGVSIPPNGAFQGVTGVRFVEI